MNNSTINESAKFSTSLTPQIILGFISLFCNMVVLLLFFFSKGFSRIGDLIILMCLADTIIFYCITITLLNFSKVVESLSIQPILNAILFQNTANSANAINSTTNEASYNNEEKLFSISQLYKINVSISGSFFTFLALLHIFYCIEIIFIFKHPISNFSKRIKFYYIISILFIVFSFFIDYFYLVDLVINIDQKFDFKQTVLAYYSVITVNTSLIIGYLLLSLYTIYYMIGILKVHSKFYSKERKIFCVIHMLYISLSFLLWVYPCVGIISFESINIEVI